MISANEFMDYWLEHGIVVKLEPPVYYYNDDLVEFTTRMVKEERKRKREGLK